MPAASPLLTLHIAGAGFVADPSGALYWRDERLLVVADLHLEKGSAYAARRVFLPPYDTRATLGRLAAAIARFAPRRVVALGDSFHDIGGSARLGAKDHALLSSLQLGRDWIWVAGNHDPAPPERLAGDAVADLAIGPIRFRHAPRPDAGDGELAGHLHPVARVAGAAGSVRRRCFVSDGTRCILPAFGAYAGGLNLHDAAFVGLFGGGAHFAHVMGRDRVYKISPRHCLPD
jgi:DNA ligase-associated metallophosphoesterase